MAQYIDKSALVAEIERRKNICQGVAEANENNEFTHLYYTGKTEAYSEMSVLLDTLEVKEVDLDEEIKRFTMSKELYETNSVIRTVAKHFFELGLKAQGE